MEIDSSELLRIEEDSRITVVKQLVEQVIKDFNLSGLAIHYSGDPFNAYEQLFIQVRAHILEQYGKPAFMRVLNRVDISEMQYRKIIERSPNKDSASEIATLILKRELQKVVIRNYHSGNK